MRGEIVGCGGGADGAHDELADAHANCSHEKETASAELLDEVETGKRRGDVYRVGDYLDDEGVLEAGVLEVLSSVVD